MTIEKEARQQQEQLSLSQALLLSPMGLGLQGFRIPGQQSLARMGPEDRRANLLSLIELAMADVDDYILDNTILVTSAPMAQINGEYSFRTQ
jgi:hypothetical protein